MSMTVDRLPLSVSVITFNEERNLGRCLESVRELASEIIIVDSGSTDRTAAIAREYGATFLHADWSGFVAQKAKSIEHCSRPWLLCLDADEAISPELAESIRESIERDLQTVAGYWLNRRTWYLGQWIWHAWYPEWRLRLVRRGCAEWCGDNPHGRLEVKGETRRLDGDLLHYPFRDLEDHLRRTLRYAKISSEAYAARGRRCHWQHLLLSPWCAFLKHLVLKQGFRDGWRGWMISVIRGIDVFAKYAFLFELERIKAPSSPATRPGFVIPSKPR